MGLSMVMAHPPRPSDHARHDASQKSSTKRPDDVTELPDAPSSPPQMLAFSQNCEFPHISQGANKSLGVGIPKSSWVTTQGGSTSTLS